MLDLRKHTQEGLRHPGLARAQEEAMILFGNGGFTEKDWTSLKHIHRSEKRKSPTTTGASLVCANNSKTLPQYLHAGFPPYGYVSQIVTLRVKKLAFPYWPPLHCTVPDTLRFRTFQESVYTQQFLTFGCVRISEATSHQSAMTYMAADANSPVAAAFLIRSVSLWKT